jgi:hypothetical protein
MQRSTSLAVLLLVLLALPYATSIAQDTPKDDGNNLLRQCTVALRARDAGQGDKSAWFNTGWCLGYVSGFGGGYLIATDPTIPTDVKESFAFCGMGERRITIEQSVRILVEWLRTHPKLLDLPKSYVSAWAFADAFPCPSSDAPKMSGRQHGTQRR